MGKKVAIVQSNYIPWKGYFDLIRLVDEFILFDDMQFTKRDWRNRNIIRSKEGLKWLTIPVETKDRYFQKIIDTKISKRGWAENHWKTFQHCYASAVCFKDYSQKVEKAYTECSQMDYLSHVNHYFITLICELLNIPTKISWSMDYPQREGKSERLVSLCQATGADHYLSGPSAKGYITPELFKEAGIKLEYMDYSSYPEYPQCFPGFEHGVTILDLLFNKGKDAVKFMKPIP